VHVWSEEDRVPPWDGQLELLDAETGDKLEIGFDAEARESYTGAFDEHAQAIQRVGLRNAGRYVGLSTGTPLEEAVFGPMIRAGGVE
jgi:hypothetical protein